MDPPRGRPCLRMLPDALVAEVRPPSGHDLLCLLLVVPALAAAEPTDPGFTELRFERPLTDNPLARLTSSAESNTVLRATDIGWRWNQSASWCWRVQKPAAVQVSLGVAGHTQPTLRLESRRFSLRLRCGLWRPWLYYEIQSFVQQRRRTGFESVSGIALRLETRPGDAQKGAPG